MYWETLPNWFWALYYLFLFITLGTALYSVMKRKMHGLSIVAIVITITVPIVSLINSIARVEGMNEFEHLINQLEQGAIWAIFTIIGYVFLLIWWGLFLFKYRHYS
ncbi:hypothetical protein [Virgibacillus halodenitrificans]|uniref:hypothetical protein n=1 Tax=Virgibacillus halodenitrificans TaxID=1482 RepID=UPI000EF5459C|nr:hypothetical protein [Virgibacillus halodenitrificans]